MIEQVGDPKLRLYIYNFTADTGIRMRSKVIARLIDAYGDVIAGVKDSSGDWNYVAGLIGDFPKLSVFSGWETHLPRLLAAGGAGNISGMANVIPNVLRELYIRCPESVDDPLWASVVEMVEAVARHPITPALKALSASLRQEPYWRNIRPPLMSLERTDEATLSKDIQRLTERIGIAPVC